MTTSERLYEGLSEVRKLVPLLAEALVPGTPQRWTERELTEAGRLRQDAEARIDRYYRAENAARGIKVLGDGKAPLRLDVLDTQVDLNASVQGLEESVCDRLGLTPLASARTTERVTRIISLISRIVMDTELADHALTEVARMGRLARRALGDAEPVYRLKGRCPICDCLSLRAFPEREIVACVNSACRCDDDDCQCHGEPSRSHRWFFGQWEDLSDYMTERDAA
ncbi:hypothetical protein [Sphaerisporangium rhizosphaerae]|uniref:Uncharacterized protein n=1 Tax=Sphaerisporangium rhizosphaerae TaxID=2269375 RepID=A0ABW2NTZ0_9ACTN